MSTNTTIERPGGTEAVIRRQVISELQEFETELRTAGKVASAHAVGLAVARLRDGRPADDPADDRRRIYLDGKGDAWIDCGVDEHGTRYIAQIQEQTGTDEPKEDVRARTGSLREIGRAW